MGGYLNRLHDLTELLDEVISIKYYKPLIGRVIETPEGANLWRYKKLVDQYLDEITSEVSEMEKVLGKERMAQEIRVFTKNIRSKYNKHELNKKISEAILIKDEDRSGFETYFNYINKLFLHPIDVRIENYVENKLLKGNENCSNRFKLNEELNKNELLEKLTTLHGYILKDYIDTEIEEFLSIFNTEYKLEGYVNWKNSLRDLCYFIFYLEELKNIIVYDGTNKDVISNCFRIKHSKINYNSFKNTLVEIRLDGENSALREPLHNILNRAGFK